MKQPGILRRRRFCHNSNPLLPRGLDSGVGALYMLTSSSQEIERLKKLSSQMECLLQQVKLQYVQNSFSLEPPEAKSMDLQAKRLNMNEAEGAGTSKMKDSGKNVSSTRMVMDGPSSEYQRSERSNGTTAVESNSVPEKGHMDELEAEFEAEFELLQLNLTSGLDSLDKAQAGNVQEVNMVDLPNCSSNGSSSNDFLGSRERHNDSWHGEINRNNYAVSAVELDIRLREVLETRQKERISDLEAQLEAMQMQLLFKENELLCWKEQVLQIMKLPEKRMIGNNVNVDEEASSSGEDDFPCSDCNGKLKEVLKASLEALPSMACIPTLSENGNSLWNKEGCNGHTKPISDHLERVACNDRKSATGVKDTCQGKGMQQIDSHMDSQIYEQPMIDNDEIVKHVVPSQSKSLPQGTSQSYKVKGAHLLIATGSRSLTGFPDQCAETMSPVREKIRIWEARGRGKTE